jgi:hypothetical protein
VERLPDASHWVHDDDGERVKPTAHRLLRTSGLGTGGLGPECLPDSERFMVKRARCTTEEVKPTHDSWSPIRALSRSSPTLQ